MEHRPLGRSGIRVSRFGLGTMVLGRWGNRDDAVGDSLRRLGTGLLDAIDGIVAPGTTINAADLGWISPGLAARERRRR
jgi:hypothetical protein